MLVHVRLEELMVAPPMGLGLEQRNVRRATFASAASARTRKPSKSLDLEADATTEVSNIFPSYDEITTGFAELGGDDITQLELCNIDRKSTRLNSSHTVMSYAVFCLKKKKL